MTASRWQGKSRLRRTRRVVRFDPLRPKGDDDGNDATNDEVYALTAYILSVNKLIGENDGIDAKTLPKVRMPN